MEWQHRKGPNKALLETIEELHDCLNNLTPDPFSAATLTWSALGLFLLAILLLAGLAELVRLKRRNSVGLRSLADPALPSQALAGMMGAMLGCLAAQPMYDRALPERAADDQDQVPPPSKPGESPVPPREEEPEQNEALQDEAQRVAGEPV